MKFNTKDITYYCQPFDHWVLDNFLDINDAKKLSNQFIDFDNPTEEIIHYKGWIGEKRTCNRWDRFPPLTYSTFSPDCCPSVYSSSTGCLCDNNNEFSAITTRGGNRSNCDRR